MATQLQHRPEPSGRSAASPWPYDRDRLRALLSQRTLKRGRFELASGKVSGVYFNCKTTMMHPEGALLCASGLMRMLRELEVDYIGGLEMGAVPLLSVIAALSAHDGAPIPSFFVRKTPKKHGTQLKIEGLDDMAAGGESLAGRSVVLIDDVATTGGSIVRAVDEIAAAGGRMSDAIVILDREEGARELLAERGITLRALFTARELGVTKADLTPLA